MTTFIVLGSLMVLAAFAIVLWPVLSRAPAAGRRWSGLAIAVVAIPALAVALYLTSTNWDWNAPAPQSAEAAPESVPPFVMKMISGLEEKLKADSSNLDGWLMLGRSYFQIQQYGRSVDAFQRAYTLSRGANIDAIAGLGEAMIYADSSSMSGPAAELFEQGFELAPRHPKVLWYSGVIAYQNGQLAKARERWSALAALNPPPEVAKVLREKIAEIETQMSSPAR